MKRKIYLLMFLCLLPIINIKAISIDKDAINASTYVIGNYMFTRDVDEETGYDGRLNTQRIMLAAKTITGNTEADMIIYYKTARGNWIDALSNDQNIEVPETFDILNIDLNVLGDIYKVETITKKINNKDIVIRFVAYVLGVSDANVEIYCNDTKIKELRFYEWELSDTISETKNDIADAILELKNSGLKTIVGEDSKEYLIIDISVAHSNQEVIILNDNGEKVFDQTFQNNWTDVFLLSPCPNDEFVDEALLDNYNGKFYYITNNAIYYLVPSDSNHVNQYKLTLNSNLVAETRVSACSATFGGGDVSFNTGDFEYYQTRDVEKENNGTTINIKYGFYKISKEFIGIDVVIDNEVRYTIGYNPFFESSQHDQEVQNSNIDEIIDGFVNSEVGSINEENFYIKLSNEKYTDLVVFANSGFLEFAGEIYNNSGALIDLVNCPDYNSFLSQYRLDHNDETATTLARYYIENGSLYYLNGEGDGHVTEYKIDINDWEVEISEIGIYQATTEGGLILDSGIKRIDNYEYNLTH